VVGVMAWPVTHSQSPPMHNAVYVAARMDLVYVPFPVHPDRVGEAVRGLRGLGMIGSNVTIPHKQAVMEFLDEISPEAQVSDAVNTIKVHDDGRLTGASTDAFGFLKSLEADAAFTVRDKRVVLVGTGGAGRAMAVGCVLAGARSMALLNRTEAKRAALRETLQELRRSSHAVIQGGAGEQGGLGDLALTGAAGGLEVFDADPASRKAATALAEADLLINATSLGMKPGDPLPVDASRLHAGLFVYDAIYTPAETVLLREARQRGCRALSGLGMLVHQGARSIQIWTGRRPDVMLMTRILESRLQSQS
jgi:shikimate dehydrogenase